eukprot:5375149-Pleurochrysis_carterae.AAC.1
MPPLPPWSTRSPCRSAARACTSIRPRTVARCRTLRPSMPESPSSRSFASSLASRSYVCSCSRYAMRLSRENAKPVLSRSLCSLSWSQRKQVKNEPTTRLIFYIARRGLKEVFYSPSTKLLHCKGVAVLMNRLGEGRTPRTTSCVHGDELNMDSSHVVLRKSKAAVSLPNLLVIQGWKAALSTIIAMQCP